MKFVLLIMFSCKNNLMYYQDNETAYAFHSAQLGELLESELRRKKYYFTQLGVSSCTLWLIKDFNCFFELWNWLQTSVTSATTSTSLGISFNYSLSGGLRKHETLSSWELVSIIFSFLSLHCDKAIKIGSIAKHALLKHFVWHSTE